MCLGPRVITCSHGHGTGRWGVLQVLTLLSTTQPLLYRVKSPRQQTLLFPLRTVSLGERSAGIRLSKTSIATLGIRHPSTPSPTHRSAQKGSPGWGRGPEAQSIWARLPWSRCQSPLFLADLSPTPTLAWLGCCQNILALSPS